MMSTSLTSSTLLFRCHTRVTSSMGIGPTSYSSLFAGAQRCSSSGHVTSTQKINSPLVCEMPSMFKHAHANCFDWGKQQLQNLRFWFGNDPRLPQYQRKKVVILGTGWAAMNFLMRLDVTMYDVSIISPRNYFTFTPLLPSVCSGTLSARSCIEPIRNKMFRGGKKVMDFYEGWAMKLDSSNNCVNCKSKNGETFSIPYDYLIVTVGAEANTFGIPGVEENAYFLKEVENAHSIRKKVLDSLEQASLPNVSEEIKRSLLHFVVVGGGPTGVETAAEISDFVREDCQKHFPDLMSYIKVTLVEMLPKVLPMFSDSVSSFSINNLKRLGIETKMESRVTKMSKDSITIMDSNNREQNIPCGFVLWASGVGQVDFSKSLLNAIPQQKENRVLRVNEKLQLIGGEPHIYGMGDCTYFTPEPLQNHIDWLYQAASQSNTGAGTTWLTSESYRLATRFPQLYPLPKSLSIPVAKDHMSKEEFTELLRQIDTAFKAPPPTAQNATQEGRYLAAIFNRHYTDQRKAKAPSYIYHWKGSLAYVGGSQSVLDTPWITILGGLHSLFFWRSAYWSNQMSLTNKFICLFDWSKSFLRGRDVGRDHSEGIIPKVPSTVTTINRINSSAKLSSHELKTRK